MRQYGHDVYHLTDAEVVEMFAELSAEEKDRLLASTREHGEESYQQLCKLLRRMKN